jgi:hypothetical protein
MKDFGHIEDKKFRQAILTAHKVGNMLAVAHPLHRLHIV